MKKILMLCLLLLLCTACMKINGTTDYASMINEITSSKDIKANTTSSGYKYYLPVGISKVYDKDYNHKFKYEDVDIYMYVDVVSYYYHNSLNFKELDTNSYYYYEINNNDKLGYVKVEEKDNNYFVKIVYNYAKIETSTTGDKLDMVIANSMIILNSIDYNKNLIEKILEDEYNSSAVKEYKIKKPEDAKSKFSEYLSEYVVDDKAEVPDLPDY